MQTRRRLAFDKARSEIEDLRNKPPTRANLARLSKLQTEVDKTGIKSTNSRKKSSSNKSFLDSDQFQLDDDLVPRRQNSLLDNSDNNKNIDNGADYADVFDDDRSRKSSSSKSSKSSKSSRKSKNTDDMREEIFGDDISSLSSSSSRKRRNYLSSSSSTQTRRRGKRGFPGMSAAEKARRKKIRDHRYYIQRTRCKLKKVLINFSENPACKPREYKVHVDEETNKNYVIDNKGKKRFLRNLTGKYTRLDGNAPADGKEKKYDSA
jgi:hypothetical protein